MANAKPITSLLHNARIAEWIHRYPGAVFLGGDVTGWNPTVTDYIGQLKEMWPLQPDTYFTTCLAVWRYTLRKMSIGGEKELPSMFKLFGRHPSGPHDRGVQPNIELLSCCS